MIRVCKILFLIALTLLVPLVWRAAFGPPGKWYLGLWAGLGLNLVLSGWTVLAQKVLPVREWAGYHRLRPWEPALYEALGVRRFQGWVTSPAYLALWGPSLRRPGEAPSLARLSGEMRSAELAHGCAFGVMSVWSLGSLLAQRWQEALWMALGNVVVNLYPVMLQRYNRSRIEVILEYRRRRKAARASIA